MTTMGTHYQGCWRYSSHHACCVVRVEKLQATIANLHDELSVVMESKDLRISALEDVLREAQYATVDGACVYCGETVRNGCKDNCIIANVLH